MCARASCNIISRVEASREKSKKTWWKCWSIARDSWIFKLVSLVKENPSWENHYERECLLEQGGDPRVANLSGKYRLYGKRKFQESLVRGRLIAADSRKILENLIRKLPPDLNIPSLPPLLSTVLSFPPSVACRDYSRYKSTHSFPTCY